MSSREAAFGFPLILGFLQVLKMSLYARTNVLRYSWTLEVYGTMLRLRRAGGAGLRPGRPLGAAGALWSRGSRMNLLRYINRVDWSRIAAGLFITLTYPDADIAFTSALRTRQRSHFVLKLERQMCEKLPVVWRTEFEERKSGVYTGKLAPHHHLMIFTDKYVSQPLVKVLWSQVIESTHPYLQVNVRKIKGVFGAAKYIAKYVSKWKPLDIAVYLNSPCEFGRQWGVMRPSLIPMVSKSEFKLAADEAVRATDLGRVTGKSWDSEIPAGYTIFGQQDVEKFLQGIFGDSA